MGYKSIRKSIEGLEDNIKFMQEEVNNGATKDSLVSYLQDMLLNLDCLAIEIKEIFTELDENSEDILKLIKEFEEEK